MFSWIVRDQWAFSRGTAILSKKEIRIVSVVECGLLLLTATRSVRLPRSHARAASRRPPPPEVECAPRSPSRLNRPSARGFVSPEARVIRGGVPLARGREPLRTQQACNEGSRRRMFGALTSSSPASRATTEARAARRTWSARVDVVVVVTPLFCRSLPG